MSVKKWMIIAFIIILVTVIISYNQIFKTPENGSNEIEETKEIQIIQNNKNNNTITHTINFENDDITKIIKQYFQKINQQSPEEISKLFTPNGKLIHYYYGNKSITGKKEIAETYAQIFQDDPTFKVTVENITVNQSQSDQAIVKIERTRLGKMRDISPNSIIYTFQMIKLKGSWKINEATATIEQSIKPPKLVNPVIIDGKWTTVTEWNDAQEYPMEYNIFNKYKNNGTSYLRVKQDQKYLYILIDVPSHAYPTRLLSNVYVDPEDNGGWQPQPEDYCYSYFAYPGGEYEIKYIVVEGRWEFYHYRGITNTDIRNNISASSNSTNDPYSKISHSIYEYRIPLPNQKNIRIYVNTLDQDHNFYATWPGKVWNDTPELWGKIIIQDY
ncbi:DUF4440 domain-containing protein [[Eubacterium] cellulosolvens]